MAILFLGVLKEYLVHSFEVEEALSENKRRGYVKITHSFFSSFER